MVITVPSAIYFTLAVLWVRVPMHLTHWRRVICVKTWWRHQMETFSVLLPIRAVNLPVPGEVPAQRPVTRSFDIFFDLRLNKRLSKQSQGWWFETLSCPLWRNCNVNYAHIHSNNGLSSVRKSYNARRETLYTLVCLSANFAEVN